MEFDFDSLRNDLLDFFQGMYFAGDIGPAMILIEKVRKATNEELLIIANQSDFNIEKYKPRRKF